MEKENIFLVGERKNGEAKERQFLEKENIFLCRERKKENEKEEKLFFWRRKNGEEKGGKYLEKEINGDNDQPANGAIILQTAFV